MQLLCLTDQDPADALTGLDLLPHEVRASPLGVAVSDGLLARYDAVLVDGTLDARRARSACLELARGSSQVPRIVILHDVALTALTAEWGVDEVLLPTASPTEIDARLRLLSARTNGATGSGRSGATDRLGDENGSGDVLQTRGVQIDEASFTARVHGRSLDLTYIEFELLRFLASNTSRVFTREQLLSEVWGTDYYGGTRTVDVHIRRLRAKLGDHESLIDTVRGVGYGFARTTDSADTAPPPDSPSSGVTTHDQ